MHLRLVPEVSLSVERAGITISGKADWCLGHGNIKGGFASTLIVLEAKKLGTAQSGLPQLIIYLAAVQDASRESDKMNFSFSILRVVLRAHSRMGAEAVSTVPKRDCGILRTFISDHC
ncbi:hypothetical protein VTN77DRAFT_4240 [Rasamsonia byssochlamydoides]|uniref:uncharacterized protein n=1 Tax=Rasamsonia byssochlamydoides TaxID=89139 RepID=UPI0037426D2F